MMDRNARVDDWVFLVDSGCPARVLDVEELWDQRIYRVWVPDLRSTLRVSENALAMLDSAVAHRSSPHFVTYASAAARIADALERDTLVAPLSAPVIPLPHQLWALSRSMSGDRVRYLLADEVGLGKTIEAGLILRELKARGLARRILVVAPAGLVLQWVQEMKTHFDEDFRLVAPRDFSTARDLLGLPEDENIWRLHDQVVCPVDSVKPLDGRRGWSREQLARYNQERHEDLVSAGWDLIIVDEAHRLGGSSEGVARYRLGEALAMASPYLLLLSATPHQGKTDSFRRLMTFLDPDAFPEAAAMSRAAVAPYVIRTEKRQAIDAEGKPLFKPRRTQLLGVDWGAGHEEEQALYEAVTEYVREGYNQAVREKRTAVGFLLVLMQRLVTSSTRAIRTALEKRLETLELPEGQLALFGEDIGEDWDGMSGQEQLETVLRARLKGLRNERREVELLLSAARRCETRGPDTKAEALLSQLQRLSQAASDPELKALVFTEFVATQEMLKEFLGSRGFSVVTLNGSMGLEERRAVMTDFRDRSRVLVSTDAGGEGLNLQFCHVVVNYDLPWNPMKIEQRIGRVDRIGQEHVVEALNLTLRESVEERVREVLEEKLKIILAEFGVDKLADVLDTEEGGVDFDRLYVEAVVTPERAEERAAQAAEELRKRILEARNGASLLTSADAHDPAAARRVSEHQLPFWTERMTVSWLISHAADGTRADPAEPGYELRWPDGATTAHAVFNRRRAGEPNVTLLSIEDDRVRALFSRLPVFVPGDAIRCFELPGISDKVSGHWSLWRIALETTGRVRQRVFPLFESDDGRFLAPTARAIWDRLIESDPKNLRTSAATSGADDARRRFETARDAALRQGEPVYRELLSLHEDECARARKKGINAFEARLKMIGRLGLPQVIQHRKARLALEREHWESEMKGRENALPELMPILLVRVAAEGEIRS
jgi:superfamily II DNA or RNA helicase